MAEKVVENKNGVIQWRDIAKSWVMAVLLPIATSLVELIKANGSFDGINWSYILTSTLMATIIYIGQRTTAPPAVTTFYKSNEEAEAVKKEIQKDIDKKQLEDIIS